MIRQLAGRRRHEPWSILGIRQILHHCREKIELPGQRPGERALILGQQRKHGTQLNILGVAQGLGVHQVRHDLETLDQAGGQQHLVDEQDVRLRQQAARKGDIGTQPRDRLLDMTGSDLQGDVGQEQALAQYEWRPGCQRRLHDGLKGVLQARVAGHST